MPVDSLIYWIWLSLLNLSPRAVTAVLQHCGDAERAYAEESDAFHGVRGITAREAKALEWIHRQMPQEQVEGLSNFVIHNDGVMQLEPQVDHLIHQLDSLPQH